MSRATRTLSRDRQRPERLQALEGAAHPAPRAAVHRQPGDRAAVEADRAVVGLLETADHVEAGGLAGTVGTDQAGDPAGLGDEARVVDRGHPAELDDDVVNLEQRHARPPPPPVDRRAAAERDVESSSSATRPRGSGSTGTTDADPVAEPAVEPASEREELVGQAVRVAAEHDRADAEHHEHQAGELGPAALQHRQQHQPDAAQRRAGHRGDAADDGEQQQRQAVEELEVGGADGAAQPGEQAAGEPGDAGGQPEQRRPGTSACRGRACRRPPGCRASRSASGRARRGAAAAARSPSARRTPPSPGRSRRWSRRTGRGSRAGRPARVPL